MIRPVRTLAPVLAVALLVGACVDDDPGPSAGPATEVADVLEATADDVVVPSYEALVTAFDELGRNVDALCATPSAAGLDAVRATWREASLAWRRTRATGVGPAMERRLAASIAFSARPDAIAVLLAGADPVDEAGVDAAGAAVKGLAAIEIATFGDGADELTSAAGARRCEYVRSVVGLARTASAEVLDDWTGGFRDEFVEGLDGDPQASLDELVNELIFRVVEVDDQGLRALTEAGSADQLADSRADGPAAFRLAELRATYEGVSAALETGRLRDLVFAGSEDTADRLLDTDRATTEALLALPDSATEAFTDLDEVTVAQEAAMALRVLLSTEVASELGITITFSDSDGDS